MSRNELCSCGSGKRFKHCHGALGPVGPSQLHLQAMEAHRAGLLGPAEVLLRQAIAAQPDDAASIHILGVIQYERMRYREALDFLWDAAERTGWAQPMILTDLCQVLAKLLAPAANPRQEALVARFLARERERRAAAVVYARVSVVLPVYNHASVVARAIASVAAQTYKDIELVVVDDGSTDASAAVVAQSLAGLPFPAKLIRNPHRGAAFAANAGAEAAQGAYLAFLSADDYFAPDYIEHMVREVARATPLWGYAYTTDFGLPLASPAMGAAPPAAALPKPRDFLPGSFTLLSKNAAEANGNLFVQRNFFLQLGGYRDFGQHRGWDFAVRATEQVEGVAVDKPLYFHNVGNPNRQQIPPHLGPRALIADALNRVNAVPNEFAPQFTGNRELLLRSEFRGGYTTRVAPTVLRSVAENLRASLPLTTTTARSIPVTQSADKIALIVLGFYRSGTSAFTRVLNLCGAALPEQVMASRLGVNPKGFWETEEINDLDARLLGHLGGDWDRVDFDIPTTGPLIDEFRVDASALLAKEYGDARFILIKDPRICIMGPLWRQVLTENGYRAVYVVPVRNPLEVAQSIHARGDMPVAEALALWLTYMQRAETFVTSGGIAAVHVRYAELLADWRGVVQRIARRLAVPLPIDRNAGEIDQFLEAGMHNQQASDAELEAHLSGATGDAIRALYCRSLDRCVQDALESTG